MNCPLHVLALVANGQELTEEQNMRYEHFCAYLVETVTAPMGTDDDETKRQSQAWMSDQGLEARGNGLVSFGYFQDMSKQALEECLSTDEFGYESRMQSEQQARKKKAHLTPYIRPAVSFVATDKPEWLRARDDAGRGRPRLDSAKMDSFVSKTPANIIAQQFAEQQTAAADAKREKKRGLQQHERCSTFWEAAHAGTRLPKVNRQSSDKYDLVFDPVWQTGHWYLQTMQRLGTATGITQQFLLLCGMSADCSRKDLLQALLWPYMQRKGIRRRFLANADWTAPILSDKALPAFRFGCMPQTSTSTTNPAGLEVVLATDVVWLIISQGLFAAEWAVTAHGHSVVVHLRNLASATLALLMVLIHTKIEKAAIPANSGHLS